MAKGSGGTGKGGRGGGGGEITNEGARLLLSRGVSAGIGSERQIVSLARGIESASGGQVIANSIGGVGTALQMMEQGGPANYARNEWARIQNSFAGTSAAGRLNKADYQLITWAEAIARR